MKKLIHKYLWENCSTLTLDSFREEVEQLEKLGATNIMISGDTYGELAFSYDVLETDEEYSARLAKEAKEQNTKQEQAEKKRAKDKELYEKLKKEFGE